MRPSLHYVCSISAGCILGVFSLALLAQTNVASAVHSEEERVTEYERVAPTVVGTTSAGTTAPAVAAATSSAASTTDYTRDIRRLPFYSQFTDIDWPSWRGKSCGVASVAMIVDFYRDNAPTAQALLERGLKRGHYITGAGWSHTGLARLAEAYGVRGRVRDFTDLTTKRAVERLKRDLEHGPVIASVHYGFDPQSTIPHLVVIRNIIDGTVYYSDPAEESAAGTISRAGFIDAWKQRAIAMEQAGSEQ